MRTAAIPLRCAIAAAAAATLIAGGAPAAGEPAPATCTKQSNSSDWRIGLDTSASRPASRISRALCSFPTEVSITSLTEAISLNVQHISAYALTYESGTPLTRAPKIR